MNITIQTKSGVPIYEQIGKAIKTDILEGRLKKDEPLPSIRSLAADLRISVITTKRAYEDLEKEGMIYSVPGKGFFVDNPDREYLAEKRNLTVEEDLAGVIDAAKRAGLSKDELINMLEIIWEE